MTSIATEATPSSSSTPAATTRAALIAAAILLPFTIYSLWVIAGFGYTGFLSLAAREPWTMQLLLDLVIACSFAIGWMRGDARKRGLASWPFIAVTVLAGSVGLLSYVVWRALARPRR